MMEAFNPNSDHGHRAQQAWQILVGMAMRRQTVTYLGLSKLMYGRAAAGVLNEILGHIAYYCEDNALPRLNVIVVGKTRGKPGHQIPLLPHQYDAMREMVYETDWYNLVPPMAAELAAAMRRRKQLAKSK